MYRKFKVELQQSLNCKADDPSLFTEAETITQINADSVLRKKSLISSINLELLFSLRTYERTSFKAIENSDGWVNSRKQVNILDGFFLERITSELSLIY